MASALELFAAVGVTAKDIDLVLAEDVAVREATIQKTYEVQEFWKSIAPVGPYAHTLKSGHLDEPGDYRDGIKVYFIHNPAGHLIGIVKSFDYKSYWLEYGSVHNPEYGYAQKTVDHFGGEAIDNGTINGSGKDYFVSS